MENAYDHIIITDENAKIIFANKAVTKTTGYEIKEIIGRTPAIWGKQMPLSYYEIFWDTIKNKKQQYFGKIKNKRKNGEFYIAEINVSPILDKENKVEYFIGIERDVTKDVEIDKAKSEFVSLASHELKSPLTGIKWNIDLLTNAPKNNQEKYIKNIKDSAETMSKMIEAFLNITRIEMGKFGSDPKPTDIEKLLKMILQNLNEKIKLKELKITTKLNLHKIKPKITPELINDVLQNLISNAIKYSYEKGEIIIKIDQLNNNIKISVQDHGCGIPEEIQQKGFQKLQRAENAKKMDSKGLGLGLYGMQMLISKYHGTINVKSKEKKGTTFTVKIPITN